MTTFHDKLFICPPTYSVFSYSIWGTHRFLSACVCSGAHRRISTVDIDCAFYFCKRWMFDTWERGPPEGKTLCICSNNSMNIICVCKCVFVCLQVSVWSLVWSCISPVLMTRWWTDPESQSSSSTTATAGPLPLLPPPSFLKRWLKNNTHTHTHKHMIIRKCTKAETCLNTKHINNNTVYVNVDKIHTRRHTLKMCSSKHKCPLSSSKWH